MQRLIYEMNAEQVTTEVVESEFEDDDDTSSSVDLRSGGDTHTELIEVVFICLFFTFVLRVFEAKS